MIENDKNEDSLAAGCFGIIIAGMFIIGILMFMELLTMKDLIGCALILIFIGGLFNLFVAAEVETSYWYNRLSYKTQKYLSIVIFFLLFIPEGIGLYYMKKYSDEENDLRNRTTYMIEMPNNILCEGTYWSGKNQPISVKCVDGSFHVVNGIEVKYKMIDHKREE